MFCPKVPRTEVSKEHESKGTAPHTSSCNKAPHYEEAILCSTCHEPPPRTTCSSQRINDHPGAVVHMLLLLLGTCSGSNTAQLAHGSVWAFSALHFLFFSKDIGSTNPLQFSAPLIVSTFCFSQLSNNLTLFQKQQKKKKVFTV